MKNEHQLLSLQREVSLPKWRGMRYQRPVRAVLNMLLRLSCWSAVVWLVWNHALSNFFNGGGIGPMLSLGLGAFLYAMSSILDDREL